MVLSRTMAITILCVIGPTASGKSSRAIIEAKKRGGEVISVDSRQVYRGLDIGTEKITLEEMGGIPHHLIDIREPNNPYSAGDFVQDATQLIEEINTRGKLPILAGGSHFYFDALLNGLPFETPPNPSLRTELENLKNEELFERIKNTDPKRAMVLDPKNRRRLIRALEIIAIRGNVPPRDSQKNPAYIVEWIIINPSKEELRARIDTRLATAFSRGLIEEVRTVQKKVGNERLNELGLEYRIIGEFLRDERTKESLLSVLSAKLWQYARRQKAWIRKLQASNIA